MVLYHKLDVKNGFDYVLTFFSLISDGLGGVSVAGNIGSILMLKISSIIGLHKAAKDMCIGEKKKVFIPPQFGYGPNVSVIT